MMPNDQRNQTGGDGNMDPLLEAAEARLRHIDKWWRRLWAWHCWLTGTAVILAGLVPFGLGLLLYIPEQDAHTLNITLIVLTACGFVAQVWNVTQHNRERAQFLRAIAADLDNAVMSFKGKLITREEFAKIVQEAYRREAQESGA